MGIQQYGACSGCHSIIINITGRRSGNIFLLPFGFGFEDVAVVAVVVASLRVLSFNDEWERE